MQPSTPPRFAFGPRNYRLMFLGLGILAAGFIVMTLDSEDYGLGFMGITLGPLLLAAGFVVEFFAIMAKSEHGPAGTPSTNAAPTTGTTVTPAPPVAPAAPTQPTYQRR